VDNLVMNSSLNFLLCEIRTNANPNDTKPVLQAEVHAYTYTNVLVNT